jgi:heme oxygenase (biliverdin-IX-beta and delta-forming)
VGSVFAPGEIMGGVRATLREATKVCHERLERRLPPEAITCSRRAYTNVLVCFYGFYAPLEARLQRAPSPVDITARAKTPALRDDLIALGYSRDRVDRLPRCVELPEVAEAPEALGSAYVIEGATLGGRVIAKAARTNLGIGASSGGRFFDGYGRDTGSAWRRFVDQLERSIASHERARAARAAAATFDALEAWIAARVRIP